MCIKNTYCIYIKSQFQPVLIVKVIDACSYSEKHIHCLALISTFSINLVDIGDGCRLEASRMHVNLAKYTVFD